MFGFSDKKFLQARVETLEKDLRTANKLAEDRLGMYRSTDKCREEQRVILVDSLKKNQDYSDKIDTLEFALSESKSLNEALEDENRDLVRQLELLQTVLSAVHINVGLPTKKGK